MHLSPAILEYLGAVGLFYLVWLAAGWVLVRWRVAADWDPEFRPHSLLFQAITAVSIGHRAAPILFFLILGEWANAAKVYSGPSYEPLLLALLLFLVPYGAGEAILARRAARMERASAGDLDPAHLWNSTRVNLERMRIPLVVFAATLWMFMGDGTLVVLLVAVLVGGQALRLSGRYEPAGRKEARLDFPDLPLKKEVDALLRKALNSVPPGNGILIQPLKAGADPFKVRLMHEEHSWGFRRQLIVPVAVLQHLDPCVYTAALARDLAFARITGAEPTHSRHTAIAAGCLTLPVLGLCILVAALTVPLLTGSTAAVPFVSGVLFMISFALVVKHLRFRDAGRDCYRDAFLNWYDADPDADRTVEHFVAALAQAEHVIECISRPEVTLHRLQRDRALMDFLDHCGPATKRAALDAAREALENATSACNDSSLALPPQAYA